MNAYLIFGAVAVIAIALVTLGKVLAGVGAIILFAEAIIFAFYVLFNSDEGPHDPPGPKI
jgi:hypothetical protein